MMFKTQELEQNETLQVFKQTNNNNNKGEQMEEVRECGRCLDTFSDEWEDGIWIHEGKWENNWVCNHCHGCIAD